MLRSSLPLRTVRPNKPAKACEVCSSAERPGCLPRQVHTYKGRFGPLVGVLRVVSTITAVIPRLIETVIDLIEKLDSR